MSYEAWGDDDGAGDYEHLLDAGWWSSEQVEEVTDAIKELAAEPVYQNGVMSQGISARFIARLTILQSDAGLTIHPQLVVDAERLLATAGDRQNDR